MDEIRKWAEARGGALDLQEKMTPGILRIEFPDAPNARDENLVEIAWDEFFKKI